MPTELRRYLFVVSIILAVPLLALAALDFKLIDRPGARDTLLSGINDDGWIAGTSETAAQANANTEEGFLLHEGNYKTIFFPGSFDTDLGAVNDRGVVFGTYGDGTEDHCFEWSADEGYKTVNLPSQKTPRFPDCNGMNEEGDRVGSFVTDCLANDPFCNNSGTAHGFLLTEHGTFTQFDKPGATGTEFFAINGDGDIVGTFTQTNGNDGAFVLHKGVYTEIHIPGSTSVDAYGISDKGAIVGSYTNGSDHGFLLRKGKITTIDVNLAGAETNKVTGINDGGWMVGVYTKNGTEHGFKVKVK